MTAVVLDASALVAFLRDEPGADLVDRTLAEVDVALLSTVNLTEVLQLLGPTLPDVVGGDDPIVTVVPFDEEQARDAADLHPRTRAVGLSLGDRACLALGRTRGLPVLTADRAWEAADVGIEIRMIRE